MNEQEFEKEVREIKQHLQIIGKNTNTPIWRSFVTGTLSGLGGILGVAIALALIGLILNTIGVIPAFKNTVHSWQQTLDNLSNKR